MSTHIAASDCECARGPWIGQRANTVSSLTYVAAGALLASRGRPAWRAAFTIAMAGVGSVAYHGPGGRSGRWLHDTALAALAAYPLGPGGQLLATIGAGGAIAAKDDAGLVLTFTALALATAAPGGQLRRFAPAGGLRPPRIRVTAPRATGTALVVIGAAFHRLGRAGGPWCRPSSPFQPHAAWHVLSAAGAGMLLADQVAG